MSSSFVIAAAVCCVAACRSDHPTESATSVRCPSGDELVHGRELGPSVRAGYAITARHCIADGWSERAVRCVRDAPNFDDEDRCLHDLLTPGQREALSKALGELSDGAEATLTETLPKELGVAGLILLVEHAGSYTLRNDWFEVTFPGKPGLVETTDKTPAGARIPAVVAQFDDGPSAYAVIASSIPSDVTYDPQHALEDSRNDLLEGAGAKLISDSPANIGGSFSRRVVGRGGTETVPLYVEALIVYDERHRTLVSASAMTRGGTGLAASGARVLASLTVRPQTE